MIPTLRRPPRFGVPLVAAPPSFLQRSKRRRQRPPRGHVPLDLLDLLDFLVAGVLVLRLDVPRDPLVFALRAAKHRLRGRLRLLLASPLSRLGPQRAHEDLAVGGHAVVLVVREAGGARRVEGHFDQFTHRESHVETQHTFIAGAILPRLVD